MKKTVMMPVLAASGRNLSCRYAECSTLLFIKEGQLW